MNRRVSRAAAAMCLTVSVVVLAWGGPARAGDPPRCLEWETVYGITRAGALEGHAYCVSGDAAGLRSATRRAASAGWWLGGQVFSSGTVVVGGNNPLAVALNQVGPDGKLMWYGDDGRTLFGGVAVGTQFGDWRRYRSLFSSGGGSILGVDPAGRLVLGRHDQYPGADESWSALTPWQPESHFAANILLSGQGDGPRELLGIDPTHPRSITAWSMAGELVGRDPIVGATLSGPPTWVDGVRGYGRGRDGRIVRLTLESPGGPGRRWVARSLGSSGYVRVFAGGRVQLTAVDPWEWQ